LQVVLGPIADQVAGEIRAQAGASDSAPPPTAAPAPQQRVSGEEASLAMRLLAALGGAENLRDLGVCSSRVRVDVIDPSRVDAAALDALAVRGVARPEEGALQVIIGPRAEAVAEGLRAALAARA
jgi:PTS system N-acetylglucosamine-specific IIC component